MKIMKLVVATMVTIVTAMIITILSSSVYAGTVLSADTTENQGKITVSGTVDSSVYAVAVVVYSGDNLEYMETANVNDDGTYNVELGKVFDEGTYTVKVADYNGGAFETQENVVVGTPSDDEEIEATEEVEEDNANENSAEQNSAEENKVAENNEKSPQTGDIIRNVFIVLAVATAVFIVTTRARGNKKVRKH